LREQIAEADATMARLQRALDAGWDPVELRDQYNSAVARKRGAEVEQLVEQIGSVVEPLDEANPQHLAELYGALQVEMIYDHDARAIDVFADPRHGVKL